ncbi:unnamed protein product [Durusdinium trenchii]|uniref:Uncharacterized protein n=1 Tax=Durusdinium trenchii TaxID=1381693 RepID=A0ABP0IKH6_9DINO
MWHVLHVLLALGACRLATSRVLLIESAGADVGDCSQPCASLQYAISQVEEGDIIRMGSGIFAGSLNRNLNPSSMGKGNFTIEGKGRSSTAETIVDLQSLGRFMLLDAVAGDVTIQTLSVMGGNCAGVVEGGQVGAGFALVGSSATLRHLALTSMDCSSPAISPQIFNGGAMYLKDSVASIQNVIVTDCIANHGAAVAAWGADRSIITDSVFERHVGTAWGGTMLIEESSMTEFHRCRFSHGQSDYGGILDDGGIASPLFTDCIFEYGASVHGAGYYGYGSSQSRFMNTIFRNGFSSSSGGAVYLTADTKPEFTNVTFFNNTARSEAGAVRSYAARLRFTSSRFTQNSIFGKGIGCAMQANSGYLTMEDVDFEDNSGCLKGTPMLQQCSLQSFGENVTFSANTAGAEGGAIEVQLQEDAPASISLIETIMESNHANSNGGAIACSEASGEQVALSLVNSSVLRNTAYGNGAGLHSRCSSLTEQALFVDVSFHRNRARLGAVVFFNGFPSCRVPVTESNLWNASQASAWSWSDFGASVTGNIATLGNCTVLPDGLALQGFPGMALSFEATLKDFFGQVYIDDTLTVELVKDTQSHSCSLVGVEQHRLLGGATRIQDVRVLSVESDGSGWNPSCRVSVRVPLSIFALQSVRTATIQIYMGPSATDCPSGWISETVGSQRQCKACPPGSFGRGDRCEVCEVGKFMAEEGGSECKSCPAGYGCPAGTSIPAPCVPGFFQGEKGRENCERCPIGSYASDYASTTCRPCGMGMITAESGSVTRGACVCAHGKFITHNGCVGCPDGMVCVQGLDPPKQREGYWAQVIDSGLGQYSVLLCRNQLECPKGDPELCADHREGTACNNCLPRYYPTDSGSCSACEPTDALPFYLTILGVWCLVSLLVTWMNTEMSNSNLNKLTIAAVANQLCFTIQTLSTIRQLHIQWPEPVKSLISLADLITMIDLDFLKIACASQYDHPAVKLIGQLLTFPVLVFGVVGIWLLQRACGRHRIPFDHLFNIMGLILFAFSLGLSLTTLMPFQCLPNPNGTSSMANNPGVICYRSTDHTLLACIGAAGILVYPAGIISWAAWTTYQYPARAASGKGLTLLYRYRFFFQRFKQKCYGFGLFILVRNFILALTPIVLVPVPSLQVPMVGFFLLVSLVAQLRFWPWRTRTANVVDMLMNSFLMLTLLGVAPLLDIDQVEATLVLGYMLCVPVLAPVVLALGAVVWSGCRSWDSSRKWDIFLCHHKGGGGALARYVKLTMNSQGNCRVFLDADSLDSLDTLFETVRDRTRHFVS